MIAPALIRPLPEPPSPPAASSSDNVRHYRGGS
jgi:hypothetical protein